jgi:hypothetical protein
MFFGPVGINKEVQVAQRRGLNVRIRQYPIENVNTQASPA